MLNVFGRIVAIFAICVSVGCWVGASRNQGAVGDRQFSKIYHAYFYQLQHFVNRQPLVLQRKAWAPSQFNEKMRCLVTLVQQLMGEGEEQARHGEIVLKLRELAALHLEKSQEGEESFPLFEGLVQWIYLGSDLNSAFEAELDAHVTPPKGDLAGYLRLTQKNLREKYRRMKCPAPHAVDDPFLMGNLPSCYCSTSKPMLIRMAKPVVGEFAFFSNQPTICPIFKQFVTQQKSHLYVNLMKRQGSEGGSTRCIEALEEHVPGLKVLTLDKNSRFYYQSKKYFSSELKVEAFKKDFLCHLTKRDGDYHWPRSLEQTGWQKELEQIIAHVQGRYFSRQKRLRREERQVFIELTYLAIIDALVDKCQPNSMNISCFHGIDRGPSLLVLWMVHHHLGCHKQFAAQLLIPPMVFHQRVSYASRIDRFSRCLEVMERKEDSSCVR